MRSKRMKFSREFKVKVIPPTLEYRKNINDMTSKYDVLSKSLIVWNKEFIKNTSIIFEKSVPSMKCNEELKKKDEKAGGIEGTLVMTVIECDRLRKTIKNSGLSDLSVNFRRHSGVRLVSEKDSKLFMWYDHVVTRMGGEKWQEQIY